VKKYRETRDQQSHFLVYLNVLQVTSVSLCELSINELWSHTWSRGAANDLSASRGKVRHVSSF